MTRLYYRVGTERMETYESAVARSKKLNIPITACYESINEPIRVNPKARERRVSALITRAKKTE